MGTLPGVSPGADASTARTMSMSRVGSEDPRTTAAKPTNHDVVDTILVEDRVDPSGVEHHLTSAPRVWRAWSCTLDNTFAATTITRMRSFTGRQSCSRIWPTSTSRQYSSDGVDRMDRASERSATLDLGDEAFAGRSRRVRLDAEDVEPEAR